MWFCGGGRGGRARVGVGVVELVRRLEREEVVVEEVFDVLRAREGAPV